MSRAARQALVGWAIALGLFTVSLFLFLGAPGSAEGAGEAIGGLLAHTGLAALFAWMVARRQQPSWGALRFAGLYAVMLLALAVVMAFGRVHAVQPALPFTASFEAGWAVTVQEGVSSAPQDRDLGMRQRAQWTGADGSAAMEFTCMWLTSTPDVVAELDKITKGLIAGMRAQDLRFEPSPSRVQRYGGHEWHEVDGRIGFAGETIGRQRFAVRAGERCFLSATFAGTPEAYELQQATFERVLATLREVPAD